MKMSSNGTGLVLVCVAGAMIGLAGCDKKPETAKPASTGAGTGAPAGAQAPKAADVGHKEGDGHDHGDGHDQGDGHDHGPVTALGEQTIGGFTVKASRDGEIKAGGDAPVDAWVTGGSAKVAVVRFWIGSEDAKGSVKAKADLEKDNWHSHVEIPNPIADGSKLWVEIENDKGEKLVGGFDLKR